MAWFGNADRDEVRRQGILDFQLGMRARMFVLEEV